MNVAEKNAIVPPVCGQHSDPRDVVAVEYQPVEKLNVPNLSMSAGVVDAHAVPTVIFQPGSRSADDSDTVRDGTKNLIPSVDLPDTRAGHADADLGPFSSVPIAQPSPATVARSTFVSRTQSPSLPRAVVGAVRDVFVWIVPSAAGTHAPDPLSTFVVSAVLE